MKIESGNEVMDDVAPVAGDSVRFVAEDGRTMFEVIAGKDGRSITVRGCFSCRVGGVLFSEYIDVRPIASNAVEVRARDYGDR